VRNVLTQAAADDWIEKVCELDNEKDSDFEQFAINYTARLLSVYGCVVGAARRHVQRAHVQTVTRARPVHKLRRSAKYRLVSTNKEN
jgi:hypothetical protein